MLKIIHQTQPTSDSCVSACLAMILGEDVTKVHEEFHKNYFVDRTIEPDEYLIQKGIRVNRDFLTTNSLIKNAISVLTVPSLNYKGGFHQILVYVNDVNNVELFDPAKGRAYKSYYVYQVSEKDRGFWEVNLTSWIVDFYITVPIVRLPTLKK